MLTHTDGDRVLSLWHAAHRFRTRRQPTPPAGRLRGCSTTSGERRYQTSTAAGRCPCPAPPAVHWPGRQGARGPCQGVAGRHSLQTSPLCRRSHPPAAPHLSDGCREGAIAPASSACTVPAIREASASSSQAAARARGAIFRFSVGGVGFSVQGMLAVALIARGVARR